MFTRSTLSMLAATVSLACGASAGAEAFDPLATPSYALLRGSAPLLSGDALRSDVAAWRRTTRDSIGPWHATPRSDLLASWPDSATPRAGSRLSFERSPDDERAGSSSALVSLGRLNLNEPRSGPSLGATSQADLDRELVQLRDSLNRVRTVPQVSLGMRVKF